MKLSITNSETLDLFKSFCSGQEFNFIYCQTDLFSWNITLGPRPEAVHWSPAPMQGKVGWQTFLGRKNNGRSYLFLLSAVLVWPLVWPAWVNWVIKMPPPRCEEEKHFAESRSCRGIKQLLLYLNLGLHLRTPRSTVLKVNQNYFSLEINCIKQTPIIAAARRKKKQKTGKLFTVNAHLIELVMWHLPTKSDAVSSLGS